MTTELRTPDDRRYSEADLWAKPEDGLIRVGITDFAQDQLGEIVYVELPEVGQRVTFGEAMGDIESTKTLSDLVSPVTGLVRERNSKLEEDPMIVNREPYDAGWLVLVEADDFNKDSESLMDSAAYAERVGAG